MNELQGIVVKINENKNFVTDSSLNTVTKELAQRKMSLITFVGELELLITNEDTRLRRAGVELFVSTLSDLPKDFLNEKEIGHITDFLCIRLQDHHSIVPVVLKGLSIVSHSETLPNGVSTKIFEAADLYLSCQSHQQSDRYLFYDVMFHLIKNSYELRDVGVPFLSGMLNFISGECDPRNLLFLFQNLPYLFRYSDVNPMLNDAFESISCYFPIDYVEKFDNPLVVTKKELADKLMDCLTCVPQFSELTMELAVEKLTTTLKSAKIDCLKLLEESVKKFPYSRWLSNILPIMERVHDDIRRDPDMEIWEAAMNLYNTLLTVFDSVPEQLDKIYCTKSFIENLYIVHEDELIGDDLEKTRYLKMFIDFSFQTPIAWEYTYRKLLNKLSVLDSFHMNYLVELLKSTQVHSALSTATPNLIESWFTTQTFLFDALRDEKISVKMLGFRGLSYVVKLLNEEEVTTLINYLIDCFVNGENNCFLRKSELSCMKELAKVNIDAVRRIFDHELLNINLNIALPAEKMKNTLELYCLLLDDEKIFQTFMNKLEEFMTTNDLQNVKVAFACIRKSVEMKECRSTVLGKMFDKKYHLPFLIIQFWMQNYSNTPFKHLDKDKHELLEDIVFVMLNIVTSLRDIDQKLILKYTFSLPNFSWFLQQSTVEEEAEDIKIDESTAIIMLEGIMCGLLPSGIGLYFTPESYGSFLSNISLNEFPDVRCRDCTRHILASMFHKFSNSVLENYTEMVYRKLRKYKTDKGKMRVRRSSIVTSAYVTKGLLTRGYPLIKDLLDELVLLACDKFFGSAGLNGFQVLLSDTKFLNQSYHCNIKLFYKQRVFVDTIFKLTQTVRESNNPKVRINAIKVIHLQLSHVNNSVLQSHLEGIIPILIESLMLEDEDIVTSSLTTLHRLLLDKEKLLEDTVYTFITRFLGIASSSPRLTIRVLALKCLNEYANYKLELMLPYKAKVLYELKKCLGDKKRLVRKEAVEARCRWAVLDSEVI